MKIDRRVDAGDFYPGGKVISTRPVATGGDVRHAEFADVRVETNTMPALRSAVRSLAARLGATVVSAFAVCAAFAATVQTVPVNDLDFDANPSVVTNVTFEGLAQEGEVESIRVEIASNRVAIASNADSISTLSDSIPTTTSNIVTKAYVEDLGISADFSTNNTELVETIEATAPAPGDYAAVSKAAMSAVQPTNMPMLARYPMRQWGENIYIAGDEYIDVSTEYHGTIAHRIFDGWYLSLSPVFWDQFSDVALSGSYNDLTDTPTAQINAATTTNALQDTAIGDLSNDVAAAATAATNYTDAALSNAITPSNTTFSNAVLSVGLNIDTNAVAAINALVEQGEELPIGGATTVGALLLALAAAIAALKRDKADVSALRYSYQTATVSTGTTPTVTNLADRAVNTATLGSTVTAATVTLPAATTGKMRDFYIRLIIQSSAAPTITFYDPATSATVTSADIPFGASSLADIASGDNVVLFTEIEANKWLVSVKHEEAAS